MVFWIIVALPATADDSRPPFSGILFDQRPVINVAGLFPFTKKSQEPGNVLGKGVLPGALIALDHVNKNSEVLKDYRLRLVTGDSHVSVSFCNVRLFRKQLQ